MPIYNLCCLNIVTLNVIKMAVQCNQCRIMLNHSKSRPRQLRTAWVGLAWVVTSLTCLAINEVVVLGRSKQPKIWHGLDCKVVQRSHITRLRKTRDHRDPPNSAETSPSNRRHFNSLNSVGEATENDMVHDRIWTANS